jgi:hypothetical protein
MTYRKWGRTVRYENGTTVRVEEAGEAVEVGGEFRAYPIADHPSVPLPQSGRGWREAPGEGRPFERTVMSEGVAVHETNGITWTEHTRRMHLSVVKPPFRMLIDQASFDVDRQLLELFARIEGRREPPPRMTLAPRVSAAILPSLNISLAQRAGEHPDGKGQSVESRPVEGEPPNWYRPSYRVRPLRAWLNLMALPFGRLDDAAPRAVARLDGGEVLCVDGDRVFATTLTPGRIVAAGGAADWYPFGGGVWGADMLLESVP